MDWIDYGSTTTGQTGFGSRIIWAYGQLLIDSINNSIDYNYNYWNQPTGTWPAPYNISEYHAERLGLGSEAIQAGQYSQGMFAYFGLDWNTVKGSGMNSYGLMNNQGTGIINGVTDEGFARETMLYDFLSASQSVIQSMLAVGRVSDGNIPNYLDSFTGQVGIGSQYSTQDSKARFMVRVGLNTGNTRDYESQIRIL